jgi:hypothetical protein
MSPERTAKLVTLVDAIQAGELAQMSSAKALFVKKRKAHTTMKRIRNEYLLIVLSMAPLPFVFIISHQFYTDIPQHYATTR